MTIKNMFMKDAEFFFSMYLDDFDKGPVKGPYFLHSNGRIKKFYAAMNCVKCTLKKAAFKI